MKPRSFVKRRHFQSGELALQITSMADIFTILLIFLLKGYATDAATLQPTGGLRLPAAAQSAPIREALKIEVTPAGVLLEGNPLIEAKDFGNPSHASWQNFDGSLAAAKKKQELIAASNSDVALQGRFTLIADQQAPWPLLREVLKRAAANGFTEPQLAVVKKGD
jgi:hypothetical protein